MGSIDDSSGRVLGTTSGRDDVVGTKQCKIIEIKPGKKKTNVHQYPSPHPLELTPKIYVCLHRE